jgi:hypothetical protein
LAAQINMEQRKKLQQEERGRKRNLTRKEGKEERK